MRSRWILAASVFLTAPVVHADALRAETSARPGATQRLFGAYRKSYGGIAQRSFAARGRANDLVSATRNFDWDDRDGNFAMLEALASAGSREALVAQKRVEIEAEILKEAQSQLRQPGAIRRFFGAETKVAEVDPARVERRLAPFVHRLDETTKRVGALDAALAAMPRSFSRTLTPRNLTDKDARAQFFRKLAEATKAYVESQHVGLAEMEQVLQSRLTQQIKRERAAELARYDSAPPEALHAEAMQLITDVRNAVNEEAQRAETVRSAGNEASTTTTSGTSRTRLHLGYDEGGEATLNSPLSKQSRSTSSTSAHYEGTSEQLTNGSDYVIRLSNAKAPLVFGEYGKPTFATVPMMLPVEARMVLEKVVRIAELRLALSKRAPALAANVGAWIDGARFTVLEPQLELGHYDNRAYRTATGFRWQQTSSMLGSRIKADLAKEGGSSFLDEARATMLKDELATRLTADLR